MNGRLGQLLLLLAAAVLVTGCVPPRATWAWETPRQAGSSDAKAAAKRPEAQKGSADEGEAGGRTHVVQRGENLYRIGLRYGHAAAIIADANDIDDPTQLEVGQKLVIPPGGRVASVGSGGGTSARPQVRPSVSRREPPRGKRQEAILRWPLQGVLYSRFGPRGATRHDGIDIAAPAGTKIEAAADGQVIYSGVQRGYGNIVILRHGGDLITLYAHNERNLVKEGEQVKAGQPVAIVGSTGRATGPHCHFEVRRGTEPHDPLDFLP